MSRKSSSSASSAVKPQLIASLPRGPKFFKHPQVILYRFLDTIKEKQNFVVEILNFVSKNLCAFLDRHWSSPDLSKLIDKLRDDARKENMANEKVPLIFDDLKDSVLDSLFFYIMFKCFVEAKQIDIGHKNDSIRTLLHWLILEGLLNDTFRLTINASFVETFKHWHERHVPQIMFSSVTHDLGSLRLLSKTDQDDLTGYFQFLDLPMDTCRKETFRDLFKNFGVPPGNILVVTFSETESQMAARAGFTVAKIRQANQPKLAYSNITLVYDLSEIRMA